MCIKFGQVFTRAHPVPLAVIRYTNARWVAVSWLHKLESCASKTITTTLVLAMLELIKMKTFWCWLEMMYETHRSGFTKRRDEDSRFCPFFMELGEFLGSAPKVK